MLHNIQVPRLNANEDELMIVDINKPLGSHVKAGETIFVVESAKATVEVPASVDGYIRKIETEIGQVLNVGEIILVLSDTPDEPLPEENNFSVTTDTASLEQPKPETAKQRLMAKRAAKKIPGNQGSESSLQQSQTEFANSDEIPWVKQMRKILDNLCPFSANLTEQTIVGPLSGPHHVQGVHIEEGASIAQGAIISAKRIVLCANSKVGERTFLKADSVYLGSEVKIGSDVKLHSGEILIDDGALLAEGVSGDLAGGQTDRSRLIIGAASLIGNEVILNTAIEILIERECGISPRAMLFTHSYWQSILEGYKPSFQSIRICERGWVGAGCQVLPGVTIGSGSITLSNSTIVQNVPENCMVGGIPAKVVRDNIRKNLSSVEKLEILKKLMRGFLENLKFKGCRVETNDYYDRITVSRSDVETRTIVLAAKGHIPHVENSDQAVYISIDVEIEMKPGNFIFDIQRQNVVGTEDRVISELRNFLRRHGIRFKPFAWDNNYLNGL